MRRRAAPFVVALVVMLATAACSSGSDVDTDAESEASEPLRILVTNDDGVDAEGIDVLTDALVALDDVEVTVVAPATNQSATGSQVSEGELDVTETETLSGYPAVAIAGFPADSVTWALDGGIDVTPALVVSGVNEGQNIGPATLISGTVGAAHTATAAGIPSLAVSAGIAAEISYDAAVELAIEWISDHRDALAEGDAPVETTSINVPSCPMIKELVDVPVVTETELSIFEVDCDSTLTDPSSDVEGFVNGYAVISVVPEATT